MRWRGFGNNRGRFILMQLLASGTALVVFGVSVRFSGDLVRAPLWWLLGKESEFAWLGGSMISALAITEVVVALFLALVISVIVAAEMSSLSFAYGMAIKRQNPEITTMYDR